MKRETKAASKRLMSAGSIYIITRFILYIYACDLEEGDEGGVEAAKVGGVDSAEVGHPDDGV